MVRRRNNDKRGFSFSAATVIRNNFKYFFNISLKSPRERNLLQTTEVLIYEA